MLTYKDLRAVPEADRYALNLRLRCPECEETYSAHPGDYWYHPDQAPVICLACSDHDVPSDDDETVQPLELVTERTVYVPYTRIGEWRRLVEAFCNAGAALEETR